jgi:hypothetical protein
MLQEVTDSEGRRRFHGAFTGGYSAGYYNTVGSLEGWTPSSFKSSRDDRTSTRQAHGRLRHNSIQSHIDRETQNTTQMHASVGRS